MNRISVKDITNSHRAISANDGEKVFLRIKGDFERNEEVILDFEGIELTITAFLNSSIGKLYSVFPIEKIQSSLRITNLHQDEIQLLKIVIEHAKERFNKEYPTDLDNLDLVNEE